MKYEDNTIVRKKSEREREREKEDRREDELRGRRVEVRVIRGDTILQM